MYLIRNPLWLFGGATMVGAFVFQALARYFARLSVLQSILVTELVFSLVIGRLWLRREVVPAAWASAGVTSDGLAVFLVMSEPQGSHPGATAQAWLPALLTTGAAAACAVRAAADHHGAGPRCTPPRQGSSGRPSRASKAFGSTANISPAADRRSRSVPWP
jgi:drug/metabolite transporter (DMT)-like permease